MTSPNALAIPARAPSSARILRLELRNEWLKLVRMPAFVLPAIGFPWVFYVFFGVLLPTRSVGGTPMSAYLLGTYGVFGALGVCLFALGSAMAIERGRGWTTVRRAMPASPRLEIAARLAVAAILGGAVALGLSILGATFGGVELPLATWASLLAILVATSIPFGAIGLALGQALSPEASPAVINIIYLPMSILSGLWLPVSVLPRPLQALAEWLPPYHASQLALGTLGAAQTDSPWPSILHLTIVTALAFAAATWLARRQGGAHGG